MIVAGVQFFPGFRNVFPLPNEIAPDRPKSSPNLEARMAVPTWYMKREWLDQEPGIDNVYIHYTWSSLGNGPDWSQQRETRTMEKNAIIYEGMGGTVLVDLAQSPKWQRPAKSPENARVRVLKMPVGLWNPQANQWSEQYNFHHYYEVHQRGHVWNTDLFTEEIVSHDVEFVDWVGNVVGTCAHWSVFDFDATQYFPSEMNEFIERYGQNHEFRSYNFYHHPDRSYFLKSKALMVKEFPLPHHWRSKVWGPRGSKVIQGWHVGFLDHIPYDGEQVNMREEWKDYGEIYL